tara:strand:- start:460 stop:609 length:150 start_codon:yes stop_codon:yes gene_type:complete
MGLDMVGFAKSNLKELRVDPSEYIKDVMGALNIVVFCISRIITLSDNLL